MINKMQVYNYQVSASKLQKTGSQGIFDKAELIAYRILQLDNDDGFVTLESDYGNFRAPVGYVSSLKCMQKESLVSWIKGILFNISAFYTLSYSKHYTIDYIKV